MSKNTIKVDGKVFQKTLQFGNRKKKVVFKIFVSVFIYIVKQKSIY